MDTAMAGERKGTGVGEGGGCGGKQEGWRVTGGTTNT